MPNHGKGPPKVQFCPKKHDTFLVGRTKAGMCKQCKKDRKLARKKADA